MNIRFSQINFGATPLFDIKLKKRINNAYQTVDARISELNPRDNEDKKIMAELSENWNPTDDPMSLVGVLHDNFQKHSDDNTPATCAYYITEIVKKGEKTSVPNITSIMEMTSPLFNNAMFDINVLQTNPRIVEEYMPSVKGAGELAVYAAVRLAKIFGANSVQLNSCADGFYKEIGMESISKNVFAVKRQNYHSFLKRIEDKYSFRSLN